MITIDEKIDFFKRIVLDKINQDQDALKNELDQKLSQRVLAFEKQAEEKANSYIEQFVDKAQQEKKQMILDAKKKRKEKILEIENRLNEKVYESVLERCEKFIEEPEYLIIVKKLLVAVKDDLDKFDHLKIHLIPKDYHNNLQYFKNYFQEKFPNKVISIKESSANFRGGFIIYNSNETMKLDVTFENIINQNQNFIGNQVKNLLHLEGDQNE